MAKLNALFYLAIKGTFYRNIPCMQLYFINSESIWISIMKTLFYYRVALAQNSLCDFWGGEKLDSKCHSAYVFCTILGRTKNVNIRNIRIQSHWQSETPNFWQFDCNEMVRLIFKAWDEFKSVFLNSKLD